LIDPHLKTYELLLTLTDTVNKISENTNMINMKLNETADRTVRLERSLFLELQAGQASEANPKTCKQSDTEAEIGNKPQKCSNSVVCEPLLEQKRKEEEYSSKDDNTILPPPPPLQGGNNEVKVVDTTQNGEASTKSVVKKSVYINSKYDGKVKNSGDSNNAGRLSKLVSKVDSTISTNSHTSRASYSQVLQRHDRPNYNRTNKKSQVIHGSCQVSTNTSLKAAKKYFWLFLSGLDTTVMEKDICDFLKNYKNGSYLCEKIDTRYNNYNSFKVGVPVEICDEIMKPDIWPVGCVVARYRAPRIRANLISNPKPKDSFLAQTN